MKLRYGLVGAAMLMASFLAHSQDACSQFAAAIESSAKDISYAGSDGILDNSAARATNRKLEQNMHVGLIQINLTLMQAAKCSLPKAPLMQDSYSADAGACSAAIFKAAAARANGSEVKMPPECDRSKWTRSGK